jgi:hypothetical protein
LNINTITSCRLYENFFFFGIKIIWEILNKPKDALRSERGTHGGVCLKHNIKCTVLYG